MVFQVKIECNVNCIITHNSHYNYHRLDNNFTLEVGRYTKPLLIGSHHIAALLTIVIIAITIVGTIILVCGIAKYESFCCSHLRNFTLQHDRWIMILLGDGQYRKTSDNWILYYSCSSNYSYNCINYSCNSYT